MSYGAVTNGDDAALLDKAGAPDQRRMSAASAGSTTGRFRDPEIEKRGVFASWAVQYESLFRKNLNLLWHKKVFTATMVLFPSLFILILWWLSSAIGTHSFAPVNIAMTRCRVFNAFNNPVAGEPCITLMYAPDTPATKAIFTQFASEQGLRWGADVVAAASREDVAGFMFDHVGMVDTAVVFAPTNNFTSANVAYDLWVNGSRVEAYTRLGEDDIFDNSQMHGRMAGLQMAVDSAIMGYLAGLHGFTDTDVNVGGSLGTFEVVDNDNLFNAASANVVQIAAPVMLVCGVTVTALMVLNIVTTEKHNKLLGALRSVGISESTHWLSWFTCFLFINVILGCISAAFGKLSGVSLFSMCLWSIHAVAFWLFACSLGALCIWIGSFTTKPVWVNVNSFLVFSFSTIITFCLTTIFNLDDLYAPQMTFVVKLLIFLMPWFHYAKIIHNILDGTAVTQVGHQLSSHEFTWADMAKKINPAMGGPTTWYAPSPSYNLGMMAVLCVLYMTLAWYFGQVFAGDLGASQRFWFPFDPAYWGWTHREEVLPGDTLAREQEQSLQEQSIRLHKLSKAYDKTTALKEVSMSMAKSECLALLGQNGAGKTTLVNVVSGLLSPTHGHAFIFGDSVTTDIATLRGIMGSCPQHDLLWLELTARQHLRIYARLKGVARRDVEEHVTERLTAVNLQDDGDVPVKGFSGGMKRRLSVAISSMGSPRVLFLDEPTTGMDPLSKRRTWQLIEDLKVGRVVLLTTHSMEEADALGDQIAILAQGRLRAKGSSLFLKNRWGAGYEVKLVAQPELVGELKELVAEMLPDAEIVGDNASNLTVALPRHATAHVPNFLRALNTSSSKLVKEWGLSNSTLEEVFLRLAVQAQGVNEATETTAQAIAQAPGAQRGRRICTLCQSRPTEEVTLYTAKGVTVIAPDLICGQCAKLEPAEAEAMLNQGAASHAAESSGESKPVPRVGIPATAEIPFTTESELGDSGAQTKRSSKRDSARSSIRNSMSVENPNAGQHVIKPVSVWQQTLAVLLMRGQMQAKQRKTNCCYVVFLVIIVLVTFLLEPSIPKSDVCPQGFETLAALANSNDDDGGGGFNLPQFDNCNRTLVVEFMASNADPNNVVTGQGLQYLDFDSLQNNYNPPYGQLDFPNWQMNQAVNYQASGSMGVHVWYQDATGADDLPLDKWDLLGRGVGVLSQAELVSFTPPPPGVSNIQAAVHAAQETIEAHTGTLTCGAYAYQDGWTLPSMEAANKFMYNHFPDFSVTMNKAQAKPKASTDGKTHSVNVDYGFLMYQPSGYYSNGMVWFSYNGTKQNPQPPQCMEVWVGQNEFGNTWKNGEQPSEAWLLQAVNGMNNGLLNTMLGKNKTTAWIHTRLATMLPFKYPVAVGPASVTTQAFLFPLFTMFLLPAFVATIVSEKEKRLFQMMTMEGMKAPAYWLGSYLFNMVYFIIIAFTYVACGYLFSIHSVTHASPFLFVAVLGLWSHVQSGLSFFLASLFPRARLATIVSYMLIVLVAITTGVLQVQGLDPWPTALLWVTPMGYARAIVLVLAYGGDEIVPGSELQTALLLLFLTGTIEMALGMYLHAVIPDRDGTRASPLFFTRWCHRPKPGSTSAAAAVPMLAANAVEDVDVVAERERVFRRRDASHGIAIRGLIKTFQRAGHPPKFAVRGVTFAADYGSCTGLLGPNGAGKTTTISMLTGSLLRTAGMATIGGYDTGTQMDMVYRILGVCPQFDTIWDDLTTAEHLLFYVRLRGLNGAHARARVQQTAEKVNLDGDAMNMKASELSGGMQRRLSLGIALCGDPAVVLLDEPTTGLDPDTRRQVWDIINAEAQAGKCCLLTTHSMEEADTLCSRIAIMAHGRLRCIGSQLHLKNRFGEGYKLSLILDGEDAAAVAQADRFVAQRVSRAARRTAGRVGNNLSYVLPRRGVDVAALFQILEACKSDGGIAEWGLSQCSLEEVFIKVVTTAEEEEAAVEDAVANTKVDAPLQPLLVPARNGAGAGAGAGNVV